MPFEPAHRLSSILLASASFIGLTLGAGLSGWLIALTGAALIAALSQTMGIKAVDRLASYLSLSPTGWNLLVAVGFLGFWVDMLWISGELLPAGVHFLMILLVIKLFNLTRRRDYLHLYAISLVAILASGSLTRDLWYVPVLLLYLLAGVWTLVLFHLTKPPDPFESVQAMSIAQEGRHRSFSRVTPQLFWLVNGFAVAGLGITLVLFFTMPRVSAGFYQKGFGENIRTSGFSDTVNLGEIGPIKRDPSVVMRVGLPDRVPHESGRFYLRGVAFDEYDGKSWTNRLSYRQSITDDAAGTFLLRTSRSSARSRVGETIRQNILLEPLDTPVLFAMPFIESLSGKFPIVQSDLAGSAYLPFPSSSRIEYSVVSRTHPLAPEDLSSESGTYAESFSSHFLQIPAQPDRIALLARDITHTQRSIYDKVNAIQAFLAQNFRYSLDAPLAEQDQPLDEFLFLRKTGYCEHYATAMAIMLRTIGIPARLVTGFLATEWNEYGNYYVVRQQDAHAWVEVYLPHSGWIMMDPTPPALDTADGGYPAWQALGRMMDSMKLHWNRLFVQYNAADQLAAVQELRAESTSVRNKALESFATLFAPLMAMITEMVKYVASGTMRSLGVLVAVALLGGAILLWLRGHLPSALAKDTKKTTRDEQVIVQLYGRMIAYLARQGLTKPTTTSPFEFVRITQSRWSDASSSVASITELYCRARFGHLPVTKEDIGLAEDNLHRLMALEKP